MNICQVFLKIAEVIILDFAIVRASRIQFQISNMTINYIGRKFGSDQFFSSSPGSQGRSKPFPSAEASSRQASHFLPNFPFFFPFSLSSGPSLEGGGKVCVWVTPPSPFTQIVGKLRQQLANEEKGKGREGSCLLMMVIARGSLLKKLEK